MAVTEFILLNFQYDYPSNAIEFESSNLLKSPEFIEQLSILYAAKEIEQDLVLKW